MHWLRLKSSKLFKITIQYHYSQSAIKCDKNYITNMICLAQITFFLFIFLAGPANMQVCSSIKSAILTEKQNIKR